MEISSKELRQALQVLENQEASDIEKATNWIGFHLERSLDLEESSPNFENDEYMMAPFDESQPDDNIVIFRKSDNKSFTITVN